MHPRPLLLVAVAPVLLLGACNRPSIRTASGAPNPAEVYRLYCEGCHGKDGRRGEPAAHLTGVGAKPLVSVLQVITEGRKAMPAWKDRLKPDEIEAVARHIHTRFR